MISLLFSTVLCVGGLPQTPALRDDPELRGVLTAALNSRHTHLAMLADRFEGYLEEGVDNNQDFKAAALNVLRHAEGTDARGVELYHRLLQRPVIDDVTRIEYEAGQIVIDGTLRDWPSSSWVDVAVSDKRNKPPLKAFSITRDGDALLFAFATHEKPVGNASKRVYGVEIRQLATRFQKADYTLHLTGRDLRIYDAEGQEKPLPDDNDVLSKGGSRGIESRVPLVLIDSELRSIAARAFILDPKTSTVVLTTPWIALPTGPVSEPLEVLMHLAAQPLPAKSTLPVAVAFQEGLLMRCCPAELRERIMEDAAAWLAHGQSLSASMELHGLKPLDQLPVATQLAWACRYGGQGALETIEEYEFSVPTAATLKAMRDHATRRAWFDGKSFASIREEVTRAMERFDTYDWPNDAAQAEGQEYEDARDSAYYKHNDKRHLSYRDVGVNRRWRMFVTGRGFKGSLAQRLEFERALAIAVGLPTLYARHFNAHQSSVYSLSFDGQRNRWHPAGMAPVDVSSRDKVYFGIQRPWSRPERFSALAVSPDGQPKGPATWVMDMYIEPLPSKKLAGFLKRGLAGKKTSASLLPPLK